MVERQITKYLNDKRIDVKVTCPDDVEKKEDATFTCDVVEPDGSSHEYTVIQTNDHGDVSWAPDPMPIDTEIELIRPLKTRLKGAVVTCPKRFVWVHGPDTFTCKIDKSEMKTLIVYVNKKNEMTWDAVPDAAPETKKPPP